MEHIVFNTTKGDQVRKIALTVKLQKNILD